jgi:hypothetical protein
MAVECRLQESSFGRAELELAGPAEFVKWKQNYSISSMRRQ